MAKKISVILLENIPTVGRAGEVASVAEGYARNQLFPTGRAALATSPAGERMKEEVQQKRQRKAQVIAAAQQKAEQLEGTELILKAKVKEGEDIFGSITTKDIAEELLNQTNLELTAKQIGLEAPIKKLGTTPLTLELMPEVDCQIQVTVVSDEEA